MDAHLRRDTELVVGKRRIVHEEGFDTALDDGTTGTKHDVDTKGLQHGSLSFEAEGTGAAADLTVKVFGSNFPQGTRQDGEGEELGTTTLAPANGSTARGSFAWATKGYRYVYVEVTVATDATLEKWALHLTGSGVSA